MERKRPRVVMEEINDVDEVAKARKQRERFDQNAAWLQRHISGIYSEHRGKFICIAGEELFVADTVKEAITQASVAHPDDDGWFTRYIPEEKVAACTQQEALDMSVLGCDILEMFAVIVDRSHDLVCLLGARHRYRIEME